MDTSYIQKFNEKLIRVINERPGFFGKYFTLITK